MPHANLMTTLYHTERRQHAEPPRIFPPSGEVRRGEDGRIAARNAQPGSAQARAAPAPHLPPVSSGRAARFPPPPPAAAGTEPACGRLRGGGALKRPPVPQA